jgi:putative membrane protein
MENRPFKRTALTAMLGFATAGLMFASASAHSQTASDSTRADSKSDQMSNKSAAGGKVSTADSNMMRAMAQTHLAEIATGKLAQTKSQNDEVKAFGQKMIDDHTTAQNELLQLAQSKGVTLPIAPDAKQQAEAKKLEAMSGDKFDKAYMAANVKGHSTAHQLLQRASSAKDPDLKAHAAKVSAVVDTHWQTARQMKGGKASASMGSSSGSSSDASSNMKSGSGSSAGTGK